MAKLPFAVPVHVASFFTTPFLTFLCEWQNYISPSQFVYLHSLPFPVRHKWVVPCTVNHIFYLGFHKLCFTCILTSAVGWALNFPLLKYAWWSTLIVLRTENETTLVNSGRSCYAGYKWAESLNFQRLVSSKLNPLRLCLPLICTTFASVTRYEQLGVGVGVAGCILFGFSATVLHMKTAVNTVHPQLNTTFEIWYPDISHSSRNHQADIFHSGPPSYWNNIKLVWLKLAIVTCECSCMRISDIVLGNSLWIWILLTLFPFLFAEIIWTIIAIRKYLTVYYGTLDIIGFFLLLFLKYTVIFLPISGNTSLHFVTQSYSATTESSLHHQNPPWKPTFPLILTSWNGKYINPFPDGEFVLPVLVPPNNGLKASPSKPETFSLRHVFHMGMHKILELKQVVILCHMSKLEELC